MGGLSKGDWSDFDIFFRGAGDIIGATKLDEEILAEMKREEEAEDEVEDVVEVAAPEIVVDSSPVEATPNVIVHEEITTPDEPDEGWFGVGRGEEE